MRKRLIAGNWKMNHTPSEAEKMLQELGKKELPEGVEALLCAPATDLYILKKYGSKIDVGIGAQNMHPEESGAFTGEISPLMLKDLDVSYVILGHSERREIFHETDEFINEKMQSAYEHDLKPILCVGETLKQRQDNEAEKVVKEQLIKGLAGISEGQMETVTIAYEPIWAIGTGEVASPEDAQGMCKFIRGTVKELYNDAVAEKVRILYGGSVKPANVTDIVNQEDIDGALVGGASLSAEDFYALLEG